MTFTVHDKAIITCGEGGDWAINLGSGSSCNILDEACLYGGGGVDECIYFHEGVSNFNINTSGIVIGNMWVVNANNSTVENVNIEKGKIGSMKNQKPLENLKNLLTDMSSMEGTQQEIKFQYLTSDGELQSEKINAYIVEIGK